MKVINLTNPEQSEIKYKISKFPDGQQNITVNPKWNTVVFGENNPKVVECGPENYKREVIQIKSRLNNWKDLELIVCTVACLRELGVKEIHLYTPYFMGARSDRKFENGGNWYLKQVICPVINNLNFETVTVLDAHSSVLGNLLNNFRSIDNTELVNWALGNIQGIEEDSPTEGWLNNNIVLVSPDAGASHKIQKIADQIGYKGDIITCRKERDTQGNLTKTVVPINQDYPGKDFIIIDDICDGGRTFINIAKEIKAFFKDQKIYLIVTHGIFSAGFEELGEYFDGIYCTNSYSTVTFPWIMKGYKNRNSQQLNVF